jgi:steroid delta-isomerase-like uncharacterized protein
MFRISAASAALVAVATIACVHFLSGCHAPLKQAQARVMSSPPGAERMKLEKNRALVTHAVVEIFNERKYEAADQYFATDFRSHNPQILEGPEGIKVFARRFAQGFADFRGDIQNIVAEGDKVVIWIRWHGTHTGSFAGVPPTGNKVEFETVEIFRVESDKLAEHWDVVDRLALQSGLGLVQPRTSN